MTENEAIESALKKLEEQKENFGMMDRFDVDENWAVRKALEEIQQYRSIGTVEECQKYKKGNCIARITFDEEKMQEIVKEQIKEIEIDINAIRNDVIDSFVKKTEERISEIEDEYENLTEKNPYILMAKREFLNGKILAYRSAIDIMKGWY